MRSLATCSLLVLGLAGCPDPETEPPPDAAAAASSGADAPSCPLEYLGDKDKDAEMQVVVLGADATSTPLEDGGTAPLIFPPQGGRVIFAGVRATNLDPCAAELSGVLRDVQSKQIRLDTRTVNLKPLGDGWGGSNDKQISTFANIPACPNQWSTSNIFGTEFELEVKLTDRDGKVASAKMRAVPACTEPGKETECLCICKAGYKLGENCESDGGAGGSGP